MRLGNSFDWNLDSDTTAFLEELKARYRVGLPALAPGLDDRYLQPDDLLNQELDLGGFESPLILSMMAVRDPFASAALAAASRILPRAAQARGQVRQQVGHVMVSRTRHPIVRKGVGMVMRQDFDEDALVRFVRATIRRIDDDRGDARAAMADYLKRLTDGSPVPLRIMDDLLKLSYRCSLSPATVRRLIINAVESSKVSVEAKVNILSAIKRLPRQFQLELITRITSMKRGPVSDTLRRCLEDVFLSEQANGPAPAGRPGAAGDGLAAGRGSRGDTVGQVWMVPRYRALDVGLAPRQPMSTQRYVFRGDKRLSLG